MTDHSADKYLAHRAAFRERAAEEFHNRNPEARLFLASMGELVARNTLLLSLKDFSANVESRYLADLFVSFCRSHFIAADLLVQGELVEAATLIRKQMEVMARAQELAKPLQLDLLLGKTPNVRHLAPQLHRLYSEYSAIAHSATPVVLGLLGRIEHEGNIHTPIYPEFDTDAYVALNHLGWLCVEFQTCTGKLYPVWFPETDLPDTQPFLAAIFSMLVKPQEKRASAPRHVG